MKKSIILLVALAFLAACQPKAGHNGTYVAHINGEYSVGDDTIIVNDTIVTNNIGYQKIRHGRFLPKEFKSKTWTTHSPGAPVMRFQNGQLILGKTIYKRLP